MKIFATVFLMITMLGCYAQSNKNSESLKKVSFTVKGDCGQCKDRIEKAAKSVKGVKTAEWNSEFQMITVSYDTAKTQLIDIHKAIAAVGHDTEQLKAEDKVYNDLPGCCRYRK